MSNVSEAAKELAANLYDRFVMGGWEPSDAWQETQTALDLYAAEAVKKALPVTFHNDFSKVTRVDVIDAKGRSYVNRQACDVEICVQDNGRTLKLFCRKNEPQPDHAEVKS